MMDGKEHILEQYKSFIDLYKFYVDMALKVTSFYFVVTGAILAFCASNPDLQPYFPALLSLPFLFGLLYGLFAFGCILQWNREKKSIKSMLDYYNFAYKPETNVLVWVLGLFGILLIVIGLFCSWIGLIHPITLPKAPPNKTVILCPA